MFKYFSSIPELLFCVSGCSCFASCAFFCSDWRSNGEYDTSFMAAKIASSEVELYSPRPFPPFMYLLTSCLVPLDASEYVAEAGSGICTDPDAENCEPLPDFVEAVAVPAALTRDACLLAATLLLDRVWTGSSAMSEPRSTYLRLSVPALFWVGAADPVPAVENR